MNTLWKKELREGAVIAALGCVVLSLLLASNCRYGFSLERLQLGEPIRTLQPLLSPELQLATTWFFPIFAALLGFLQGFSERHRDLWAFLVHRPLTRRQLFLGKVTPGLALYAVAGGLPLLGLLLWVRTPGHVAAPFDWAMTLPVLADYLTGVGYYFAGLIVAIRQARWHGTRLLAVGTALLLSFCAWAATGFASVLLGLAVGIPLLVVAAAAVFDANGADDQLPAAGRVALPLTLAPGAAMLVLFGLAVAMVPWMRTRHDYSYYAMTRDGAVYCVTRQANGDTTITNLAGQPYPFSGAKDRTVLGEFNGKMSASVGFVPGRPAQRPHYRQPGTFFSVFRAEAGVLWVNDGLRGGLAGFDAATRQSVGYLTPDGFSRTVPPRRPTLQVTHQHLYGTNALYRVDLAKRELRPVLDVPAGDTLLKAQELAGGRAGTPHLVVMTRQSVRLLDENDRTVWSVAYPEALREDGRLSLQWLGDEPDAYHRFALWFRPPGDFGKPSKPSETGTVYFYSASGQPEGNLTVPALKQDPAGTDWLGEAMAAVAPLTLVWWGSWYVSPLEDDWRPMLIASGAGGVLAMLVGLALTHPFRLPLGRRVGWSLFLLLAGPTGLLVLWGVEDWPAREACPHCGQPRVVNRAACEHCGQPFNPPPRDGTEIFETVGS